MGRDLLGKVSESIPHKISFLKESQTLCMDFYVLCSDSIQTRTVGFTEAPLGIEFRNAVPVVYVASILPNSVGERAGVQPGWVLKAVAGESALEAVAGASALEYDVAIEMLDKRLQHLLGKSSMR